MTTLSANFIGCGKLGKTIARLLYNHGVAIGGIVNTNTASGEAAVTFIGQGCAYASIRELPPADIYFITTNDSAIRSVCHTLATEHAFGKDALVVHCSGSLTSDILGEVKSHGCHVASIHPLKSMADPKLSIADFAGTYCAIEGDEYAIPILTSLFEKIGGQVFPIQKANKMLYHAASVMANNYLITLHYQVTQSFKTAGIDEQAAKKMVSLLMQDALNNVAQLSHVQALTGPMQRGDTETIAQHMQALASDDLVQLLYAHLGIATLPLTPHTDAVKEALKQALVK